VVKEIGSITNLELLHCPANFEKAVFKQHSISFKKFDLNESLRRYLFLLKKKMISTISVINTSVSNKIFHTAD
jgi:hypothetical protein